jgi:hypothetical protein
MLLSICVGGGLGNRYAVVFAPLSIVQAIGSTTTLFVFAFGIVLALLFPSGSREDLSMRELVLKGFAAVLVAAGVALVTQCLANIASAQVWLARGQYVHRLVR